MTPEKAYLGDGVYAEYDGYHIVLSTERGLYGERTERIYLEEAVYHALTKFHDAIKESPNGT